MDEVKPLKQLCFSCIEKQGKILIEQSKESEGKEKNNNNNRQYLIKTTSVAELPIGQITLNHQNKAHQHCSNSSTTTTATTRTTTPATRVATNKQIEKSVKEGDDHQIALEAAKSMAALAAKLIKAAQSRPLRQINVVGQLNHSAKQGFLLVMTQPLVSLLTGFMLIILLMTGGSPGCCEASVWPFGSSGHSSARTPLWPSSILGRTSSNGNSTMSNGGGGNASNSRRATRMSGDQSGMTASGLAQMTVTPGQSQPPAGAMPPVSQQFHYFWNHDQIEPKVVASEANKILSEAQTQTDRNLYSTTATGGAITATNLGTKATASDLRRISSSGSGSTGDLPSLTGEPKDTMMASGSSPVTEYQEQQQPIVIPAAIQQQLTNLVLQMQRQQQMSMMMQPRFDHQLPAAIANRRVSHSPFATTSSARSSDSPFWMQQASSEQQPSAFLGPPGISGRSGGHSAHLAQAPPTAANIAGVPVFGPFLVAPSPYQAAAAAAANARTAFFHHHQPAALIQHHHHQQLLNNLRHASNQSPSARSAPARSSSGFLGRTGRKSWPFLSSFHPNNNNNDKQSSHHNLFAAASHARPTIVAPPSSSHAAQIQAADLSLLPPESMALLDIASSQLVNAIAGQMQVRAAQQRLAAALSQAMDNPDFMQVAASSLSSSSSPDRVTSPAVAVQSPLSLSPSFPSTIHSKRESHILLPPYLMSPSSNPSPTAAAARAIAINLASNPARAMQSLELLNSVLSSATNSSTGAGQQYLTMDVPFGNRLKRRHLNTVAPSTEHKSKLIMASKQQNYHNDFSSTAVVTNKTASASGQKKPITSIKGGAAISPVAASQAVASVPAPEKRIVKKDSANLRLRQAEKFTVHEAGDHDDELSRKVGEKRAARGSSSSSSEYFVSEESQHQVRRLKRSALLFTSNDSMNDSKGWKSMDSSANSPKTTGHELLRRQAEISSASSSLSSSSSSSSSSSPPATPTATSSPVQKSSDTSGSSSSSSSGGSSISGSESDANNAPNKISGERQEKSLKIKRIIASASVLHHPHSSHKSSASSSQQLRGDQQSTFKRGAIISGTPVQLNNIHSQTSNTNQQQQQQVDETNSRELDPMISALSESTRVANYFQNVDTDTKSPGSASKQLDTSRQQSVASSSSPSFSSSSSSAQTAPKINLAFSAPSKMANSNNNNNNNQDIDQNHDEMRRMNSGNGGSISQHQQQQRQLQIQAAGGRNSVGGDTKQRFAANLHRQTQRHLTAAVGSGGVSVPNRQSQVNVGNGDISSAATQFQVAAGAYGMPLSNAGSSSSSSIVVAPPTALSTNIQTYQNMMRPTMSQQSIQSGQIAGQSATNMANYARSNSPAAPSAQTNFQQSSNIVSALVGYDPSNSQQEHLPSGRKLKDNAFGATSFNRHSVVAPGTMSHQQSTLQSSADQSNNYNDEMLPPQPMQQQQQQQQHQQNSYQQQQQQDQQSVSSSCSTG